MNKEQTFDEYWESSPGIQGLDLVPANLVRLIASAAFLAGEKAGLIQCKNIYESVIQKREEKVVDESV